MVFKFLLLLCLLNATLKVLASGELGSVHEGNKQGCFGEEISHLLEGAIGGLGENGPEVNSVGKVTDLRIVSRESDEVVVTIGGLTIKRMYHLQPMPVLSSRATDVVWPIMVLKAKDIIVARDTPLARVFISKISAGMIQDKGPQVALKEKL
jgi:hypothetical protein